MTEEPLFDYGFGDQEELIAAAAVIREYCGWHIAPSITEELVLDGSGATVMLLDSLYVTELTEATNAGAEVSPLWSQKGWMRIRNGLWTGDERGVTVTITHGYAECPKTVRAVARRLARQGAGMIGSGSVKLGQVAVTVSKEEAAGVIGNDPYSAAILDSYRIVQRS